MRPLLARAGRDSSRHSSVQPLHRGRRGPGAGMNRLEPREVGLIAAAISLIADQGSKLFMVYGAGFPQMTPGMAVPVLPFFNLVMVWNPGISYGLFPASGRIGAWGLIGFSDVATFVLTWVLLPTLQHAR